MPPWRIARAAGWRGYGETAWISLTKTTEVSQMATKDTGGQRQTTRRSEETEETSPESSEETRERQEKLSDDVEAILDEIDEVLEENAEEFVRSYVQKGGQ
jgi:prokaryotic ubiquitin-like protein Pup